MKKVIIAVVAIASLLSFNFASGREIASVTDIFQPVWEAIADLQNQINNIQLTPGPQGPAGPQGPRGVSSQDGAYFRLLGAAGNSTYYAVGDRVYAIDLNQSSWEAVSSLPPVPVSNLVLYNYVTAVTYNGEGWRNQNYNNWQSIGFIPSMIPGDIILWTNYQPIENRTEGSIVDINSASSVLLHFDYRPQTSGCQYAYTLYDVNQTEYYYSTFLYLPNQTCSGSVEIPVDANTRFVRIDSWTSTGGLLNGSLTLTQ